MSSSGSGRLVDQNGFTVATRGRGFSEITRDVADLVAASGVQTGIAQVFTAHTSCSLLISENADPTVRGDLERWMARVVPDGDPMFRHDAEGPDDMPAHIRSILSGVSLAVPVGGLDERVPARQAHVPVHVRERG